MNIRMFAVFFIVVVLIGLYAALSLNPGNDRIEPSGVLLAVPPDYFQLGKNGESLSLKTAAKLLLNSLTDKPENKKIALKFIEGNAEQLILVDTAEDAIHKNAFNPNGTIVQTTWRGSVLERLAYAMNNGNFSPEHLEGPTRRNLYH